MPEDKTTEKTNPTLFEAAGAALASMHGSMSPGELSAWFSELFPEALNGSGSEWEQFKVAYLTTLWSGTEELASPVFVTDTNPEESRETDAVGFMTLTFVTSRTRRSLELLDQYTEVAQPRSERA